MERRRNPRILIQCPVLVQRLSEPEVGLFALLHNISLTGVRFLTETALTVGSDVQVSFFLPNQARASTQGTVVRIEEESRGRFGVAIDCKQPFEGSSVLGL
jgi:PilZ domain-containing protein